VEGMKDYSIFMLDREGRILSWNPGAESIWGYSVDEIKGQNFAIFYPTADREQGRASVSLGRAKTEGRFEEEVSLVRKGGTHFWVSVTIVALKDEAKELTGYAFVCHEIPGKGSNR